MRAWLVFLQGFTALMIFGASVKGADSFTIAPPEAWVDIRQEVPEAKPSTNSPAGGIRMLLEDNQKNTLLKELYHRTVKEVVDANGVQSSVQLSFDFDPSYETLVIHSVTIRRGTNTLNRLDAGKIKMIEQERDLDRNVYNGEVSAVLFLEDVRVGDWIDFSYTVRGENPVFGGRFSGAFYPQSETPLAWERFRLIWPAGRSLGIAEHGAVPGMTKKTVGDTIEYGWEMTDVPADIEEDSLPSWYDSAPWVQFSEYPDWKEVGDWATRLFPRPQKLDGDLQDKVAEWQRTLPTPEARLDAALKFVQNEVRYLGIEVGPNSHQPTDPSVVFARRFGDCKDKAYLFCSLLQAMNIDATEALVQTDYHEKIADWLPTPYAFNHVVSRVKLGGRVYWLDPTESEQGGAIGDRFFPDYGRCLLVGPDATNLTAIPEQKTGWPLTTEHERIVVRDQKQPADLTIQTIAQGEDADEIRQSFADNGHEEMEKRYLNYYARQYPKIKTTQPLEVIDDPDVNTFETVEHYQVDEFWKLDEDKTNYECEFYPQVIRDLMAEPDTTLRSMPVEVTYPRHQILDTEVVLPEAWPTDGNEVHIASVAAKLDEKRTVTPEGLRMTYEFTALTNRVMPGDMAEYLKNVDRMKDELGYTLTWGNKALLNNGDDDDKKAATGSHNWGIISLATVYVLMLLGAGVFFHEFRRGKVPPLLVSDAERTYAGLGGWLIVMGLAMVIGLVKSGYFIWDNSDVYAPQSWYNLTNPAGTAYAPGMAAMLIMELLGNLTVAGSELLLLVFFFERRRLFPRGYIGLVLFNTIFVTAHHIGAYAIPSLRAQLGPNQVSNLIGSYAGALIWIPYLLRSKRVKATFIR